MSTGDKQEGIESAQGRPEQMVRAPLGINNSGPQGCIVMVCTHRGHPVSCCLCPEARVLAPIMFTGCSSSSGEDETIPSSPFHAQICTPPSSTLPLWYFPLKNAHLLSVLVPKHSLPPLAWPLFLGQLPALESSGGELITSLSHAHPHKGHSGPLHALSHDPTASGVSGTRLSFY